MTIIIQRNYQSFWVVLNFQGKRFPKTHIPYPIGSIEIEYLPTFTYSKCTSPTEHMGYGPIESIYHFRRISPSKARKTLRVPTLKVSWSGPCRNEAAASPFARFDFWAHRLVKSLQLCHHEYIFQGGAPLFNSLRLYSQHHAACSANRNHWGDYLDSLSLSGCHLPTWRIGSHDGAHRCLRTMVIVCECKSPN